jgi:hypothetical protein
VAASNAMNHRRGRSRQNAGMRIESAMPDTSGDAGGANGGGCAASFVAMAMVVGAELLGWTGLR